MMILAPEFQLLFDDEPSFEQMMALKGEVYRELENRRTQRVVLRGRPFFIKQHFGIGWKEIFKNLFQLRLPVLGASNEWHAIQFLKQLNIPTLDALGYGLRGKHPAHMQSFLITRELPPHDTLEDLTASWAEHPPAARFKWQIIKEVARIARIMHDNGMNHRDFYICHLVLEKNLSENDRLPKQLLIRVIDLHRAQLRRAVPQRWRIKDLAGLYFSSKDIGLTRRDLLRFIKEYRSKPLSYIFNKEAAFWQKVKRRGDQLYQKHTE